MYLFNELNGWNQVKAKVNELPLNTLAFVLLLFQNKHVMVEELLQFLVCQVDTKLLKWVHLKQKDESIINQ